MLLRLVKVRRGSDGGPLVEVFQEAMRLVNLAWWHWINAESDRAKNVAPDLTRASVSPMAL